MIASDSLKTVFNLLLIFIVATLFFTGFSDKVCAADSPSESGDESTSRMSNLLNMDIRDLMNIKVVSATGSMKSLSETPENVTVITAEDIKLMNAHTIPEVLNTVTGVAIDFDGANLGIGAAVSIQGSDTTHVTVLIDGVPTNNLASGFPVIMTHLPVQVVERIEIIKGPASSTWGSALGGVINIITKSGSGAKGLNGTLSASYGEDHTGDYRSELYGQKNKFEYYLFAGNFQTSGLQPGFDADTTSTFSKLAYRIAPDTKISASFYYDQGRSGEGYDVFPNPTTYFSDRFKTLLGNLSLNTRLSSAVSLDISLYTLEETVKTYGEFLPDMSQIFYAPTLGQSNGARARATWTAGMHTVVFGFDYSKDILKTPGISDGRQSIEKEDVLINDTMVWGNLSVVPGLRFDNSNDFGNFVSPSLGATYKLTDNTLLRAQIARGFNDPNLIARFGTSNFEFVANNNLEVEDVNSYQFGVETTALSPVWLKASVFRHDVNKALENVPVAGSTTVFTWVNTNKVRHQGVEVEIETNPVYHTSLFGGATYVDSKNLVTDTTEMGVPKYVYNAGLKYDNDKLFKAVLNGHYIWWNQDSAFQANYNAMIFDLSITKTVFRRRDQMCDIFFTAHNIFDGSQYAENFFPNPGRWFEGGVRYKF
jgi:vitamin B12 transporter